MSHLVFGFLSLTSIKYLIAGKGILGLEQTNTSSKSATKTLEITEDNPKEKMFGQSVVIYDLNLSLQFVTINFKFSLL